MTQRDGREELNSRPSLTMSSLGYSAWLTTILSHAQSRVTTERKPTMPITKENYAADELLLVAHSLLECAFWAAEDDGVAAPASGQQLLSRRIRSRPLGN